MLDDIEPGNAWKLKRALVMYKEDTFDLVIAVVLHDP